MFYVLSLIFCILALFINLTCADEGYETKNKTIQQIQYVYTKKYNNYIVTLKFLLIILIGAVLYNLFNFLFEVFGCSFYNIEDVSVSFTFYLVVFIHFFLYKPSVVNKEK